MAPATVPESTSVVQPGEPPDQRGSNTRRQSNARTDGPRRRTKTGCLTCRRRRIKCGEERPTCRNCFKSRRHCEGYLQPIIFREPFSWPAENEGLEATLMYHSSALPGTAVSERQPPPLPSELPAAAVQQPRLAPNQASPDYAAEPMFDNQARRITSAVPFTPMTPMVPPSAGPYMTPSGTMPLFVQPHNQLFPVYPSVFDPQFQGPAPAGYMQSHPAPLVTQQPPISGDLAPQEYGQVPAMTSENYPSMDLGPASGAQENWQFQALGQQQRIWFGSSSTAYQESAGARAPETVYIQPTVQAFHPSSLDSARRTSMQAVQMVSNPNAFLQSAAVENQDDEYFDVDSDDDAWQMDVNAAERDLGVISRLHQQSGSDIGMRHYDTFIYQGVLDHYQAEFQASPLKNELTARVFSHFISATAPMLSVFERNPRNSSAIFASSSLPVSQQSLWTHSMPLMALSNQGLLHAMLALASLHIANLQGATTTPSLKHYTFALKRVHKAVTGESKKRHHVATLAATLLLGYYEVMTADHAKWCSHVYGAKQLLVEMDFPAISKEAIRMEREGRDTMANVEFGFELQPPAGSFQTAVDEHLTSTLAGQKLPYDEFGRVINEINPPLDSEEQVPSFRSGPGRGYVPTQLDLHTCKLYQDLWWWFARQDTYQSIISGNRLLMEYSRWNDCPPRGRIGQIDAPFGTHDHVFLLLARVADFSARDRKRKLSAQQLYGEQWKPPSGGEFKGLGRMPPPPGTGGAFGQSNPGQQPQMPRKGPSPPQPQFMGMAPLSNKVYMPSSYRRGTSVNAYPESPEPDGNPSSPSPPNLRIETDLAAALDEWCGILSALNILGSHLGPQYHAIDSAFTGLSSNPIQSPFGPAICFQKFDVAVLNAMYHLCRIILYRSHPEMPPASMVAAGVATPFTSEFANKIGQIAAGIFTLAGSNPIRGHTHGPASQQKPLNPSIGGLLCELTVPLFFSGVQYQSADQRAWLVDHLFDIEVRTGWTTAGVIGHGCETAWKRTAEAGRGPPYERSGYWGNPDQDSRSTPPAWAQGVRGFENEPASKQGLDSGSVGLSDEGETSASGDCGISPLRERSLPARYLLRDDRIRLQGHDRAQMLRDVPGDHQKEAHWAMGLMRDDDVHKEN